MIDVGIAFCFGLVVGGLISVVAICLCVVNKNGEIKSDELFSDNNDNNENKDD